MYSRHKPNIAFSNSNRLKQNRHASLKIGGKITRILRKNTSQGDCASTEKHPVLDTKSKSYARSPQKIRNDNSSFNIP